MKQGNRLHYSRLKWQSPRQDGMQLCEIILAWNLEVTWGLEWFKERYSNMDHRFIFI